jgi:hypothetical protein
MLDKKECHRDEFVSIEQTAATLLCNPGITPHIELKSVCVMRSATR